MPSGNIEKDMPILIKHFKGVEGKILKMVLRANCHLRQISKVNQEANSV
jgi:hypothetical protein